MWWSSQSGGYTPWKPDFKTVEHFPPLSPAPHPHITEGPFTAIRFTQKARLEETEQASGPAMAGMLDLRMELLNAIHMLRESK